MSSHTQVHFFSKPKVSENAAFISSANKTVIRVVCTSLSNWNGNRFILVQVHDFIAFAITTPFFNIQTKICNMSRFQNE